MRDFVWYWRCRWITRRWELGKARRRGMTLRQYRRQRRGPQPMRARRII